MAARYDLETLVAATGTDLGTSRWFAIDQGRIDAFAHTTEDAQYIHTDPDAAAATPFGGTIAHGFLVLSLLSAMYQDVVGEVAGMSMSMNYGFEKIRFLSPVRVDSRVRGRVSLNAVTPRGAGGAKLIFTVFVEIEGEAKPALAADWIVMAV